MASAHRVSALIDAGVAADLLAAAAAGDADRADLSGRMTQLRDVSGFGSPESARRVRVEVLDAGACAVTQIDELHELWRAAASALRDAAWVALAAEPARWSQEFVAERIESPVVGASRREMVDTPPSRYLSFCLDAADLPARRLHIPGEWLPGLTSDRIEAILSEMSPDAIIEGAKRWRYLGTVLQRSVEPVSDVLAARCVGDAAVASTGVADAVAATELVATQWRTIGDALHCFGVGVRGARAALVAVDSDRASTLAQAAASFDLLTRQPMIVEAFERRARTEFDEHYSSGLFGFLSGMRSAGNPLRPRPNDGWSSLRRRDG
jgi:hypothetical protein